MPDDYRDDLKQWNTGKILYEIHVVKDFLNKVQRIDTIKQTKKKKTTDRSEASTE